MHNLTRGHPRVIKKKPHRGLTGGLSPCDSGMHKLTRGQPCDSALDWRAGSTLALSREGDAPNLTGGLSPCDSKECITSHGVIPV